jgi:N-acetylmuramic acid 6-phosphate etherase
VDLRAMSAKLHDRGERIVMEVGGVSRDAAKAAIAAAGGHVKTAIVMLKKQVNRADAEKLLSDAGGYARKAIGAAPPVVAHGRTDARTHGG